YVYSVGKTEEDFMRCLLTVYRRIGGITEKFKTDNMSAIVSVTSSKRKVHPRIASFFKDLGVKLELCQIRSPQTKGKCESSNRFINWIRAFDYKVKSEKELIYIIEEYISAQCNREINQTTKLPPVTLFQKEIR
ncbi:MAG: transposase family protein, partial [Gallicola sp.]|nr:transposase family protein [Gallicola sp.]